MRLMSGKNAWRGAWGTAACALVGCASPPAPSEPGVLPTMEVPEERTLCGFQQVDEATRPLVISEDGASLSATPGLSIVVVSGKGAATYGAVKRALAPAHDSLVRVKVVVDQRWLLPMTYKRPVHPHPPPPSARWVSHVGKRTVTRSAEAPSERFADLRLDGDRATLHVENEAPGGEQVAVADLQPLLRRVDPPVGVFALTATDDTPWAQVVEALAAAACFDREPGQEPHEVIFD